MGEKNNLFIRCLVEHSCTQSKASQSSSCRFKSAVLVIIFRGAFNPGIPATSLNQDIELVTAWFGLVGSYWDQRMKQGHLRNADCQLKVYSKNTGRLCSLRIDTHAWYTISKQSQSFFQYRCLVYSKGRWQLCRHSLSCVIGKRGKLSERKIATLLSDCVSCVYSETGQSRWPALVLWFLKCACCLLLHYSDFLNAVFGAIVWERRPGSAPLQRPGVVGATCSACSAIPNSRFSLRGTRRCDRHVVSSPTIAVQCSSVGK